MNGTTHNAPKESMIPLNFFSAAFLSLSLLFRATAILLAAASMADIYNVLACISALMIIVINWPKFKERIKKIYKSYHQKPRHKIK